MKFVEIISINLLERDGHMDILFLKTTLPTTAPHIHEENAVLKIECPKGTGKQYAEDNFTGLPIRVIDAN